MNFDFLRGKREFHSFKDACIDAEKSLALNPEITALYTRKALELAVKWLYSIEKDLVIPEKDNLSSLVQAPCFINIVPEGFPRMIKNTIVLGNEAAHTNHYVTRGEAITSLKNLHKFVCWIDCCYSVNYTEQSFDENILPNRDYSNTESSLDYITDMLNSKDKKLEDMYRENQELKYILSNKRQKNIQERSFNVDDINTEEIVKKYIALDLKIAGWKLYRDVEENVFVEGISDTIGCADYVFYGDNGKALAIAELANDKDTSDKLRKAGIFADYLEKKYSQRPIVFLTDGFDTYLWDDKMGYAMRKVSGILKKGELQLRIDRRSSLKPFDTELIKKRLTNRYYQKEAVKAVCRAFYNKNRKALVVAATGTGKTRIAISTVDVLTRCNFARNILFLADRKELVKQAKNSFSKLLPDMPLCNLLDKGEDVEGARIVFSTYPTMSNCIDSSRAKDGNLLFTPGYFDLIIIDESHRSIYKKYQSIFKYFDANLLGLTATPKDEIDKNTYAVFELESGSPTYEYEYKKAVEDGYLVDYTVLDSENEIMKNSIKYDELSEVEKEQFEDSFDSEEFDGAISNVAINKWLFNSKTIDSVLEELMDKGLRIEGGNKLGKTIIFAKNHKHAVAIVERFNVLYPQYGEDFTRVIDYDTEYVEATIDNFKQKDKMPQIAVSVDMLDTGIDVPEILNLVFFKKVRSKTKFWQMIGRGTRLCKDLLGLGMDKEQFLIFDYCRNFDFFRINPEGYEAKSVVSLNERLFNIKCELIKDLQEGNRYEKFRSSLIDDVWEKISSLSEDSHKVKLNYKHVYKYKDKQAFDMLTSQQLGEIKEFVAPLIMLPGQSEISKRFEYLIYTIEAAIINDKDATKAIKQVLSTAKELSKLDTIPQVKAHNEIISLALNTEFWKMIDIQQLEAIRLELRDLVQYISKSEQKTYYTRFDEIVVTETKEKSSYNVEDLKSYNERVEEYIRENESQGIILKIKKAQRLTDAEISELTDVFFKKLGDKEDYKKCFGATSIMKLIRKKIGLDREVVEKAFYDILNDKSLTKYQINYIKIVIDYLVKNGFVEDRSIFMQEPFKSVGSITVIFRDNMTVAKKLLAIVDEFKENLA